MEKLYSPGDILKVRLTQPGRTRNQGIGYLNDGTMIIVQNGRDYIDRSIQVEVTQVLETSTQHTMIFARLSRLP